MFFFSDLRLYAQFVLTAPSLSRLHRSEDFTSSITFPRSNAPLLPHGLFFISLFTFSFIDSRLILTGSASHRCRCSRHVVGIGTPLEAESPTTPSPPRFFSFRQPSFPLHFDVGLFLRLLCPFFPLKSSAFVDKSR